MRRIAWIFVLALVMGLVPAMADTWAWSFSGPTITGSGFISTAGLLATGGSGTFFSTDGPAGSLSLLTGAGTTTANSPSNLFQYTDAMSPSSDPLIPAYPSNPGILFVGTNVELNLWYQSGVNAAGGGPGYYASGEQGGVYFPATAGGWGESGTFSLTAVPDGGTTLSLLGLAIVGLAGLRRKLSL